MPIVFSILLALLAAWALWQASRAPAGGTNAWIGAGLVAAGVAIQIFNINSAAYSLPLSIVTTLVVLAGLFMLLRRTTGPA